MYVYIYMYVYVCMYVYLFMYIRNVYVHIYFYKPIVASGKLQPEYTNIYQPGLQRDSTDDLKFG